MITDNLSGAKGNTQSSAIIWPSLNPSLSMSGTSWHHPIANPQYLCLTRSNQSCWFTFSPLFHAFSARAQGSTFILIQAFIHYRCLLLLLLLLLLCRIVTLLTLFCIMFIAILWSIAILCIVVHCVNCITIFVNIRSNK